MEGASSQNPMSHLPGSTWNPTTWARDRSVTTKETSARRLCRLDRELAKIEDDWTLGDTSATTGGGKGRAPWLWPALLEVALCMV